MIWINKIKRKLSLDQGLTYIFVTALVAFTMLPIVYMISTAFKPLDELFLFPPRFLVQKPTLRNFSELFRAVDGTIVPFSRYIFNSLFVSAAVVFGTVIISSMAAYALVKLEVPGAGFLFNIIVAALMFSPHTTQIARYLIVQKLGLLDTYGALIIPQLAVAYNLFLIKQFMEQVPDSILEAARIEGATELRIWWRFIMPLTAPAWSTLAVLSFVSNWNDYFTALIFTSSQVMKTLPLALQLISNGGAGLAVARQGAMAAATFLTTMPTIIIFMFMQRKVMDTMAYSGIKA
ncbi:MAG: carbohydrate ABC transporter permease [Spirochaetales bacterium]|nr:carbohydrate ABC transporter permease [Spirochaetales bacterium]